MPDLTPEQCGIRLRQTILHPSAFTEKLTNT